MSQNSKIEWTQQTWNPTTGCTKISPGCKHCYAEAMSKRLQAMHVKGYENGFDLSLLPERLEQPLKRKIPTTYFVNSMSDLFHKDIPDEFIAKAFEVMEKAKQHQFQLLTKRADRMKTFCDTIKVPPNIWLGVSVEDQEYGLPRIDYLRQIDCKIRFLSIEPLLEDLGEINLSKIHWVIVGGESGSKARPMKLEWVESIQNQCAASQVAFFFKQWGGWGADGKFRNKKHNGRLLNGKTWDQYPDNLNL